MRLRCPTSSPLLSSPIHHPPLHGFFACMDGSFLSLFSLFFALCRRDGARSMAFLPLSLPYPSGGPYPHFVTPDRWMGWRIEEEERGGRRRRRSLLLLISSLLLLLSLLILHLQVFSFLSFCLPPYLASPSKLGELTAAHTTNFIFSPDN